MFAILQRESNKVLRELWTMVKSALNDIAPNAGQDGEYQAQPMTAQKEEEQMEKEMMENQECCPLCSKSQPLSGASLLKKKENPALYAPGQITNGYVCCLHHSKEMFSTEDKDPRNFKCMPPCMMESITPAGKPTRKEEALNLFA